MIATVTLHSRNGNLQETAYLGNTLTWSVAERMRHHATERHSPRHGHRRGCAPQRGLLHTHARSPAREKDGQLRRPGYLSLLLRRRDGTARHDPHVLPMG